MRDDYTNKDQLRGELKGDLLDGKRYLTAFIKVREWDEDEILPFKALVRRMSINREFAFRWPDKDADELDAHEEAVVKALLSDQRRCLRRLKKTIHAHVADAGSGPLRIEDVEARPMQKAGPVPPTLFEKSAHRALAESLVEDGWREPPYYTLGIFD